MKLTFTTQMYSTESAGCPQQYTHNCGINYRW